MKELEKLNILRVNKTDHNNMFYFFIQTLQFNFNFENWQFKKVFSFSFYIASALAICSVIVALSSELISVN